DRTGLGLSVGQGVVSRHRGSVHVRSEPGGGTPVTLWFPVASARAVEVPPPAAEQAKAAALSDIASILVLEDEDRIRTMLVEALASAGHRVESATDGLTGLARFQGGAFDVVLTDLSLPECSGLDVASSVKRLRPDTPVVLITGWGHLLDPEKMREAGVDLMLAKPFRLERVLAVLADALRLMMFRPDVVPRLLAEPASSPMAWIAWGVIGALSGIVLFSAALVVIFLLYAPVYLAGMMPVLVGKGGWTDRREIRFYGLCF